MPQILQLQSGLAACNVLCSIQKWPELWKAPFVAGETKVLKPTEFLTEINVEYSQSQVKREKEITAKVATVKALSSLWSFTVKALSSLLELNI